MVCRKVVRSTYGDVETVARSEITLRHLVVISGRVGVEWLGMDKLGKDGAGVRGREKHENVAQVLYIWNPKAVGIR